MDVLERSPRDGVSSGDGKKRVSSNGERQEEVQFRQYLGEEDLATVMGLVDTELSEPYSIFTYRYFLNQWPQLCFLVVLEAEVTNSGALALYGNLGFIRAKRLHSYYLNGVDAFRLKLLFPQAYLEEASLDDGDESRGGATAHEPLEGTSRHDQEEKGFTVVNKSHQNVQEHERTEIESVHPNSEEQSRRHVGQNSRTPDQIL